MRRCSHARRSTLLQLRVLRPRTTSLQKQERACAMCRSGYIGLEFSDVYTALGSEVTFVEAMPNIMPGFDTEIAKMVRAAPLATPWAWRMRTPCRPLRGSALASVHACRRGATVRRLTSLPPSRPAPVCARLPWTELKFVTIATAECGLSRAMRQYACALQAKRQLIDPRPIDFHTNVLATKVTPGVPNVKPCTVELTDFTTKEVVDTLEVDAVLVATGRAPYTSGLGLDAIGAATDRRGFVPANDKMQARAAHVFAFCVRPRAGCATEAVNAVSCS
jgi:pyruvate/2-oxoglutarate dehydrogenase complex dihydrolipoamide dehydrogenase (E3) component